MRNSARRLGADRQSFETYRSEGLYRPQKVGGGSAKSIGVDYAERTKRERKAREQDPQQSASYPERLGKEETENILRLLRKIIEQNNEEIKEGR